MQLILVLLYSMRRVKKKTTRTPKQTTKDCVVGLFIIITVEITNVSRTKNARFAVVFSRTVSEKAGSASYRIATAKLLSKMMLNVFLNNRYLSRNLFKLHVGNPWRKITIKTPESDFEQSSCTTTVNICSTRSSILYLLTLFTVIY